MEGLKTLKDLDCYDLSDDGGCGDSECCGGREYEFGIVNNGDYVSLEDLKKEAIKWVERLSKVYPSLDDCGGFKDFYAHYDIDADAENLVCWIKHFFGVSDEDLAALKGVE